MKKDKFTTNHLIEEEYSYLRYYYEFEDKKNIWAKESKKEGMYLVAKNAIKQGLKNELIATLTGLGLEEIEQLRHEEK